MGNATCCESANPDATLEVDATNAFRPTKKAMAGFDDQLGGSITLRGFGLKEAIMLQAALRGYLSRRMMKTRARTFKPTRDDLTEELLEDIPEKLLKLTRSVLKSFGQFEDPTQSTPSGMHQLGPLMFSDGSVYKGAWSTESKRHGSGVQYWPNGQLYEGWWEDDEFSGQGRLIEASKDVYSGTFKSGKRHGKGILTLASGATYNGGWKAGLKHGEGEEKFEDGSTYKGTYQDNLRQGRGLFIWPDSKRRYDGEWVAGEKHGAGHMIWEDKKEYEGSWEHNTQHGEGYWTDGDLKKKGEWNHGRRLKWLS
jgi:hypothetical protein